MSENIYAPGTYVKGSVERVAHSARDAVALVFDGFKFKTEAPAIVEQAAPETPVVGEKPDTETPRTHTPAPSPRELARTKSQEDDKS